MQIELDEHEIPEHLIKFFEPIGELPAKSLCMIPQRVAIALQEDGWIVRAAPQWIRRNPMPESVQDRPGNAHEYIYMLVKSSRYFFDMEAVRRASTSSGNGQHFRNSERYVNQGIAVSNHNHKGDTGKANGFNPAGRALRTSDFFFDSLDDYINHLTYIRDNGGLLLDTEGLPEAFIVNPAPYKLAHYATWPPALVAPMIQASTSARGVCVTCGAGWVRVVEKGQKVASGPNGLADKPRSQHRNPNAEPLENRPKDGYGDLPRWENITTGWQPSCQCENNAPPIPALILDPFCGSGTTGAVARDLGRRFIGLDLNPTYLSENALPRSEKKNSRASLEQLPMFAPIEA